MNAGIPHRLAVVGVLVVMISTALMAAEPGPVKAPAKPRPKARKPQPRKENKRTGIVGIRGLADEDAKPDAVIADCEAQLKAVPGDSEAMFVLAAAYAAVGRDGEAVAYAGKAVAAGVPIERFVAGPREVLAPLTKLPAFRKLLAGKDIRLIHGPALGSMTDTSVKVWVRTATEMTVEVVVAEINSMRRSELSGSSQIRATAKSTVAADYTAICEVTGLTPATDYVYQILLDGKPVAVVPVPTFRTFGKRGEPGTVKIAFGGGAGYNPVHEHMWDTVRSLKPIAFLAMGDNVYIDMPTVPAAQRYCYYRRQSRLEYRRFVSGVPSFSIWDDHDFGTNDCVGSPGIDDVPWKVPVWDVFRLNWANPAYGGGAKQPGVWYDFMIGDVHFIMLDCRFYRTNPKTDPNPTMLGPVQKKWLLKTLAGSKGTFKVIASSVPWTRNTKPGSKDTWDGFPAEREEIFAFIADNKVEGVFLISADRHRSDAYFIDRSIGYPFFEASSSRLTNIHTHPTIKHSLFGYNAKCSVGVLTFNSTGKRPGIVYRVVNIDGENVNTLRISKRELSFPVPRQ